MQSKSTSRAKALLILCLLISAASFKLYFSWSEQETAARESLKGLNASVAKLNRSEQLVRELAANSQSTLRVDEALAKSMLEVYNNRVNFGISLSLVAPGKSGNNGMTDIGQLTEDVPGTQLKNVKVNLTGAYTSYPELIGYLDSIRKHQGAVVHLKIQENSFETSIRIFGTPLEGGA